MMVEIRRPSQAHVYLSDLASDVGLLVSESSGFYLFHTKIGGHLVDRIKGSPCARAWLLGYKKGRKA